MTRVEDIVELFCEFEAVCGHLPTIRQWDVFRKDTNDAWAVEIEAGYVPALPSSRTISRRFGSWSNAIRAAGECV